MNRKILTFLGCLTTLMFVLSGCTSNNSNQDINPDTTYPLFPNAEQTTYTNDTI